MIDETYGSAESLLDKGVEQKQWNCSQTICDCALTVVPRHHWRMLARLPKTTCERSLGAPEKFSNGILAPQTTCQGSLVLLCSSMALWVPKAICGRLLASQKRLANDFSPGANYFFEWFLGQNFQKDKCSQNIHTSSTTNAPAFASVL